MPDRQCIVNEPDDTPRAEWGPSVLLTKIRPPAVREETLPRERLFARLRSGQQARLTAVVASAGSGKTTLLAEWCAAESRRAPVAWVTIDALDNDPVVLWSHVIEALRRADPDLVGIHQVVTTGGAPMTDAVLPALVNRLSEHGRIVLVLDDFHRLSAGPARDSVVWFKRHAPSSVQLVVSTRTEPPFALPSLRAHGELVEIRGDDLRLTLEEASALLNGRLDLGLSAEDIAVLVDRTEGWAAGMYLAALSLERAVDAHEFVIRFGGSTRHVMDFLTDEVLASHDSSAQELLLRSSVLDRFSGPLCDYMLEREGTGAMLTALSRTNLFLIPLDDDASWYRFHHLFGELLRMELERREPGRAEELHRRASAWHADNGTVAEAIEHALEGGAFDEAADLLASSWPLFGNAARIATLLAWLRRFPDEERHSDVRLLLIAAWVLSISGLRDEAAVELDTIERLAPPDLCPHPDGFHSVESSIALLRAIFVWGDLGPQLAYARRAAELEGPDSPWRCVACWAVGWGLYCRGESEEADPWFAEAAARGRAAEQWIVTGSALAYRSMIAGERGSIEHQQTLAEEGAEVGRTSGVDVITGEIDLAVALSLLARQAHPEALQHLESAIAAHRRFGQPIDLAVALLRYGSALRGVGQSDDAAIAVSEAQAILATCADPGTVARRLLRQELRAEGGASATAVLSARELVILRLLSGPLSEGDIARELYVSRNTVHSQTQSIYRKLGVSSRKAAVAAGRALGIMREPTSPR